MHRYKGYAVRRNVAARFAGELREKLQSKEDPWERLFAMAEGARGPGESELVPHWLFEGEHKVQRRVPVLPYSKDAERFARLRRELAAYRLVFGQPRQQELLELLNDTTRAVDTLLSWTIDLRPPLHESHPARLLFTRSKVTAVGTRKKKLEDFVSRLAQEARNRGDSPVGEMLQGVKKERIHKVLSLISLDQPDIVDAVFALLDERPTWFMRTPKGTRFCDGATTAHLGCHVGILQRGAGKLDREGRDYWVKPLRDVGAIEPLMLLDEVNGFVSGHPVAKSPNSAYRLAASFVELLKAPEPEFEERVQAWIGKEATRKRLELQAELEKVARAAVDRSHASLIEAIRTGYVPAFLPGFKVIYVDDSDGERVSSEERGQLEEAGVRLELGDAMPDVLAYNPTSGDFWVIEAVSSDGEVDLHKVEQVTQMVTRNKPEAKIGFTTAYATWKDAATRQAKHRNIAPDTYLWILQDGSKHLKVEAAAAILSGETDPKE